MAIHFIPNDPLASGSPSMRSKTPRPDRSASRAGFRFFAAAAQGLFAPGTPEFLFWQCREGALAALSAWEKVGGTLTDWAPQAPDRKKLDLLQNAGTDLNAYYDGASLAFFEFTTGSKTTFSGASTDVVAHEAGHAILDAIRPDLWASALPETNAFHEAFGDCIAIVTALADRATRTALLASTANLAAANFVEATAEDLSDGVRRHLGAQHSAAAPRHAFNSFIWQLPTALPLDGPPATLTSEIHSFGRLFSGCFYDTIRNIFTASGSKSEASLWAATRTAARLLAAAARSAPEGVRFFQAVGRAMVLADQNANAGANRTAVVDAFDRHGIPLGSAAMTAPRSSLGGRVLAPGAAGEVRLSTAMRQDLKRRLGAAPAAKLGVHSITLGKEKLVKAVVQREVPLAGLSEKLAGVVAMAPEPVLVGTSGKHAAIVSALPDTQATTDEVRGFVATLLRHGRIAFDAKEERGPSKSAVARRASPVRAKLPTHGLRIRGGKKQLVRLRFACNDCQQDG